MSADSSSLNVLPPPDTDTSGSYTKGLRHYLCGEFVQAAQFLQEASEAFAKQHGELSNEIAEPYLLYGKSLLEVARMEAGVLGHAIEGVPVDNSSETVAEESQDSESMRVSDINGVSKLNNIIEEDCVTEDEKKQISKEVIDAMTESSGKDKSDDDNEVADNSTTEVAEKPTDSSTEAAEKPTDSTTEAAEKPTDDCEKLAVDVKLNDEEIADDESADDDRPMCDEEEDQKCNDQDDAVDDAELNSEEEEDGEDVGNLQIAWEILEVARKVFDRQQKWTKVAETHVALAEISMEKEDWTQALEDLDAALDCYTTKAELDTADRRLATVYFQMAVVHLAEKRFDDSKMAFSRATKHLGACVDLTHSKLEATNLSDDARSQLETEVTDLQTLIKELDQRMSEVDEERADQESLLKQAREMTSKAMNSCTFDAAPASSNSDEAPNDISSLVRKKRPSVHPTVTNGNVEDTEPSCKKTKTTTDTCNNNEDVNVHPDADIPLQSVE